MDAPTWLLVLGVCHRNLDDVLLSSLVRHLDIPADTVEFKADGTHALAVHFAQAEVFDDQGLAVGDVDLVGLAHRQTVEEHMAAQPHDVAVLLLVLDIILHYLGIQGSS